jgi:hypothetical protein
MKDWHIKHMENTVIKHVKGLSSDATRYQKKMHYKYGGIVKILRYIEYDKKHGVTNDDIVAIVEKLRSDSSYEEIRTNEGFLDRLKEIESSIVNTPTTKILTK